MGIVVTIVGCIFGVILYSLIGLVTPIASWGNYSVGILVALCLIMVSVVGGFPWFRNKP